MMLTVKITINKDLGFICVHDLGIRKNYILSLKSHYYKKKNA